MREIDLALIGDVAWNQDITPSGEAVSPGGAAYYSGVGAAHFNENIGIVAQVGEDFDLNLLKRRKVDTNGINISLTEKTCRFILTQHPDNTRDFEAQRGTAASVNTKIIPQNYLSANYLHLPTQLPQHALIWLDILSAHEHVSVDTFEAFVLQFPQLTVEMINRARMVFVNEAEYLSLKQFGESLLYDKPYILKLGPKGAMYVYNPLQECIYIPAPKIEAVDTTGAGDVLAGAFLAQLADGKSVVTSLEEAVRLASFSVTEFGVEHIPSKEFMDKEQHQITAALLINEKGEVFLGATPKFDNQYIAPGGHFENGESPQECIRREIKEEIGVEIENLQFLRLHESFAPEYKGTGARFICHNFVGWIDSNLVKVNGEYSGYIFIDPRKALQLPNLHPTARSIIGYYLKNQA